VTASAEDLSDILDNVNRGVLALTGDPDRRDAGALVNFVTYHRRLKDKLVNLSQLQDERLASTSIPDSPTPTSPEP
jgi:hypothetical protein